ncbi:molybdenum cofactor guanylyltransferase [Natrononativus amylolyticus]|uniref:molybdenum cofactor guanylyltransferase n=1 Tax=Natrononativus amylolyticus TaxID=2963434 RepID=UPI0020CD09AA|nr:molybdenum cofactor guanylyltransferase [Natrononativus amylolyticus]
MTGPDSTRAEAGAEATGRANADLSGVVLAGGYSTRFGEDDKAVADLAGEPMIRRVVDRLAPVSAGVVVNCREDQLEAIRTALADAPVDVSYAVDPVPDQGPTGGIKTGLEAATTEYAAVVACDMPFVEPRLFDLLFERARDEEADAAVVQLEDRWYQTTQAVYRTEPMARACAAALEREDSRILTALEDLEWVVVDERALAEAEISLETFEGVDTRDSLEEAAARLGE